MEKKILNFEVCLLVEDYVEEGDTESAFELSQQDDHGAIEQAKDELEDILGYKPNILTVSFIEFDSSNWTHAGAHFECTFEATTEDEIKMQKYNKEMTGE